MLADPFRSARLVFRAIEEDDEKFFHMIETDGVAQINSSATVKPGSKRSAKEFMKAMEDCHLAIVICLPEQVVEESIPSPKEGEDSEKPVDIDIDKPEKKKTTTKKLVPIS